MKNALAGFLSLLFIGLITSAPLSATAQDELQLIKPIKLTATQRKICAIKSALLDKIIEDWVRLWITIDELQKQYANPNSAMTFDDLQIAIVQAERKFKGSLEGLSAYYLKTESELPDYCDPFRFFQFDRIGSAADRVKYDTTDEFDSWIDNGERVDEMDDSWARLTGIPFVINPK